MGSDNGAAAVRRINTAVCWAALRRLGDASVAELAAAVGLSRPTTQPILRWLATRGLATRSEWRTAHPGRPAERYAFVSSPLRLGCLDLRRDGTVLGAEIDFTGRMVNVRTIPPEPGVCEPEAWSLAAARALPAGELDVLVVCVPGVITPDGRILRMRCVPRWAGRRLSEVLALPSAGRLIAENHVNMVALAESRMGAGAGTADQLYLHIARRLKAGVIINGRLHRGSMFAAGEGTCLSEPCWPVEPGATDPVSTANRLLTMVAEPLAVMIATLDPAIVVLGGPGAELGSDRLRRRLATAVGAQFSGRAEPELRLAALGERAALFGAAIRVMEEGGALVLGGEHVSVPNPYLEETP